MRHNLLKQTFCDYTHPYCVTPRDKKMAGMRISGRCATGHRCFEYPTAIMTLLSSGYGRAVNVTCTQCDYSKNYVAGLLWAVVLLLEIRSCHKFQGLPATVKSHVPLCAVFQCYSCRVLHEPHLKSNVCFFAVEDLGLIEPVRLTQTCSLSVAVSAGLAKSCGLAGNVHMFVSTYVS